MEIANTQYCKYSRKKESVAVMKNITCFSSETIASLGYYVYIYSDPDSNIPFYVGQGQGNRVFDHLKDRSKCDKVDKISEIRSKGKEPLIEILAYGLDKDTAVKIEAAAIDLIGINNLTNIQRGHHSAEYGRIGVARLNAMLSKESLSIDDITDDVIMIRINELYRNGMLPYELYDITRSAWAVNINTAKKAKYAFAVYGGIIIEVYSIIEWIKGGGTTMNSNRKYGENIDKDAKRYEFIGNLAPQEIRDKYINKSVANIFRHGARNPIHYVFPK
jgi:hypothetical protein